MYSRMMIMEAVSEKQVQQVVEMLSTHACTHGLDARIEREEDGAMVIFQTTHATHEDLVTYHCGRAYRSLVVAVSHLLYGEPVVKRFELVEKTVSV